MSFILTPRARRPLRLGAVVPSGAPRRLRAGEVAVHVLNTGQDYRLAVVDAGGRTIARAEVLDAAHVERVRDALLAAYTPRPALTLVRGDGA